MTLVIFFCQVWPFEDPTITKLEVMNEVTTVFLLYHMFIFTDWVPDATTRYYMGSSFIIVAAGNLSIHFGLIIMNSVNNLKLILKKKCYKRSRRARSSDESSSEEDDHEPLKLPKLPKKLTKKQALRKARKTNLEIILEEIEREEEEKHYKARMKLEQELMMYGQENLESVSVEDEEKEVADQENALNEQSSQIETAPPTPNQIIKKDKLCPIV